MNKEEIKIRTGLQQKREQYLLENKSKAQIINILIDTEEYVGQLETIIDKAIEYIIKEYYSKNTTNIDEVIGGREVAIYRILKGENK